ncbi:MAG TPA: thiamine pyrophosphate-dependent enzyme [Thermoanaerobaculia bacterium]|nr:thiamine pyrophosphate-dependent enzyme [Thermoanaerobaculia bacterium]
MTPLSPERLVELYRLMLLNRLLEERLVNLYRQGKIVGGLYRSLGQEATSVGTAYALEEGDLLSPLIRNLGSVLVRGATPRHVFAQYLGRAASPSGGREAHLNFCLPARGIFAGTAMLSTMIPVLSGMLLADRIQGRRTVGMTYVGDGATSVGAFHEGLNFAAVQKLPLVLVVEFNNWAYSTPFEKQCAARTLSDKAPGYGIAAETVDGNDVLEVHAAARRAVERARAGEGPTLLECRTYRMKGHAEHDAQSYVPKEELAAWRARDPVDRLERFLETAGILGESGRLAVRAEILGGLDADLAWAEASPLPEPAEALRGVFAGGA